MSRIAVGIVVVTIWLGAVSVARAAVYALVVGVNECPDFQLERGARPKPLRGAESDADGMAQLLIDQFHWPADNVQLLKGKSATRAAIANAFAGFSKQLKPADTFVFYFAGHGTQVADLTAEEPDGLDEALCPSDVTATGEHLIIDDELGLWIEKLPCRNVTVILDCCHSGTGIKDVDDDIAARFLPIPITRDKPPSSSERKRPWRELEGSTKSIDRQTTALYACQPDQQAYERRLAAMKAPARIGQFSHFLIEGVRDKKADANKDGVITNREAVDYAIRRLDETFNRGRERSVERQEPILESSFADAPFLGKR